jgi:hypothetical protein
MGRNARDFLVATALLSAARQLNEERVSAHSYTPPQLHIATEEAPDNTES